MRGIKVVVEGVKRTVGNVEDFYTHPQTNEISSLYILSRVSGAYALPPPMIQALTQDAVIIASEEMLEKSFVPLQSGQILLGAPLVSESGTQLGMVRDILLGVYPIEALHIVGFEVTTRSGHTRTLAASEVRDYNENTVVVYDQAVRK